MKIKVLIGGSDREYIDRLSEVMMKHDFVVSVSTSQESFSDDLKWNRYDFALAEEMFLTNGTTEYPCKVIVLTDSRNVSERFAGEDKIEKYQRISKICGECLEILSRSGWRASDSLSKNSKVVAVWSPRGGVGKTTVSLSYATSKAMKAESMYLSLEDFSSTSVFFPEDGKSISKAFEFIEGDFGTFLRGIARKDSATGITYFGSPETYLDISVLTEEDIEKLVKTAASITDFLIVDLSSHLGTTSRKVMDMADEILLVVDSQDISRLKFSQFLQQGFLYRELANKIRIVLNKGAKREDFLKLVGDHEIIELPFVQNNSADMVYKNLSATDFGAVNAK